MKLSGIFGAIFFLIVLHLTLFVSGSTIQRSLSDDIRNGISIAGKIFGVDSPSNIAAISNIAELVTRAFSTNKNQQNNWDRRQLTARPSENLEDMGEYPSPNFDQGIDDNVIIGGIGNLGPSATISPTDVDHGFLGQMLRVLGMDSNKIGALAINGIIFIAQMIGRSFLNAVTTMAGKMGVKPNENDNININGRSHRLFDEKNDENAKASSIWDNALDWIVEQSKSNPFLSQQIDTMLDKNLANRIIGMVDNGDNNDALPSENTDCIKQLLCKATPFIWSMQKAISSKINDSDIDTNIDADELPNNDAKDSSPDDDYRLKEFFKYLPTIDEFTKHGQTCESQYDACKLF